MLVELASWPGTVDIEITLASIVLAVVIGKDEIARPGRTSRQQLCPLPQGRSNDLIPPLINLTSTQVSSIRDGESQRESAITICERCESDCIHNNLRVCQLKPGRRWCGGLSSPEYVVKHMLAWSKALIGHSQNGLATWAGENLRRLTTGLYITGCSQLSLQSLNRAIVVLVGGAPKYIQCPHIEMIASTIRAGHRPYAKQVVGRYTSSHP